MNINVETRDGVVQLNGFAQSETEREAAAKLAGAVGGVTSVHNNLTVKK
ncbi:MAG: BON domain-containing protein [Pseudoxanthomonas sp.]